MGAGGLEAEPFEPFEVDRVVDDGEEVDLGGGTTLRVIAAPGHTRDFTSYYVPERRILVAGEAVGCADVTGYIFTEFLVGYDEYVASIEKLAALPVDVLVQGHHYVYTDEDARGFFGRTLEAAARYKEWVERLLDEENGDVDRVVSRVRSVEYDPKPAAKQPEPAYLLNLYARVNHLAARKR
jgi:glyoxylase-like metal-dependent hydrolase (beta-lactamase superfamily II)